MLGSSIDSAQLFESLYQTLYMVNGIPIIEPIINETVTIYKV